MAKGDDVVMRKKNKAARKKQSKKNDSSKVSARVAAIIAAKKRRQSGKRRNCQGMCFSLPTLDDPFNDKHGKENVKRKNSKKNVPSESNEKVLAKEKIARKGTLGKSHADVDQLKKINEKIRSLKNKQNKSVDSVDNLAKRQPGREEIRMNGKDEAHVHQGLAIENSGCPSKFLIMCLNAVEDGLHQDGTYSSEKDKHFFVNSWGVEFWKCYSDGNNILGTCGSAATIEQIAWIASTAADTIARKEKEGLSFSSPFLLFLVPSQEKAAKARLVCKHLKAQGIHTVSLHPGASIDHQINGLKSCEPEFLVSTPERLLELVSLKAIDISGVSLLVVDGLQSLCDGGHLENVKSIVQSVSEKCHTVVFNDSFSYTSIQAAQSLLKGSICRLPLDDSVDGQSACITQSTDNYTLKDGKL